MDPEVKNVGNRKNVKFTLATNDYTYNENHELERTTSWHNIVAWGKTAEQAEKYIKKGKRIALEGRLKTRVYEKDGKKNYFTEKKIAVLVEGINEISAETDILF